MAEDKFDEIIQAKTSFEEFATNDNFIDQDYYNENGGVVIKDYHQDWVDALEKHDRIALTAFTGSGKTTIPGVMYPLWKIFTEPGYDVLVVSATMQQSTKILSEIKHHIENSEYLQDMKPEDRSAAWSKTEIETSSGSKIYCKPFSEGVKGVHVDLVICDEAAEFKDHELFSRYVQTRAESKDGTICLISTPVHENDLMAKMSEGTRDPKCPECLVKLKSDEDDEYFCDEHGVFSMEDAIYDENVSERGYWSKTYPVYRRAEDDDPESFEVNDEIVKPVFPENFDERRIRELREEDMTMFQKEYLCEPLAVEGDLFDPNDIIELYDSEEKFEQHAKDNCRYYMGADFAISHQGDYSVFTVVEVPKGGKPVLRHMERIRGMGLDGQEQRIKELHEIFDFDRIVLDETNFGSTVKENLKSEGLPIRGQDFQLKARNNLIVGLKNKIEKEEFIIPRDTDHNRTIQLTDKLYSELLGFGTSETQGGSITYKSTAKHDDTVMSLAMVLAGIQRKKPVVAQMAY